MYGKIKPAGCAKTSRMPEARGLLSRHATAILLILLAVIITVTLFLGRYEIDPLTVILILIAGVAERFGGVILDCTGIRLAVFWGLPHSWTSVQDAVIWNIRLPRTLAVLLVGAGLAASGAVFQGTFRNPLVSESILGVSAGAGVGAAIGILLGQSNYMIQLFAFLFGLTAVGMTFGISRIYKSNPTLVLVLAGIIVGSLFSAITSLIKYVADPYTKLPDIVFWLMGSFAKTTMGDVYVVGPILLICMGILFLIRWQLNVLSMGDEEARSLGANTGRLRIIVILCATLITSAAVCISGLVGWVGLIIPQMARMIVGPDHRVVIPVSILLGASYLLVVDDLCRTLTPAEIPISIVTSILGAPLFLYLLRNAKVGW